MNSTTPDILVVGAGIAGLTTALALRHEGASVTVVDQSQPGTEASWAGGGILCPLYAWRYPDAVLALAARGMRDYPALIESLTGDTDPEHRVTGMRILDPVGAEESAAQIGERLARYGIRHQWLDSPDAGRASLVLPEVANVRNPRLLQALRETAEAHGIEIHANRRCEQVIARAGRFEHIETSAGRMGAERLVVAAGAWSEPLIPQAREDSVFPVRGQMLRLEPHGNSRLETIVMDEGVYLIPRVDGSIIVGSTVERAGFDKTVDMAVQQALHRKAIECWPDLAEASVTHRWAGLRPGSSDEVPILGEHPSLEGLWVNTGGYRNGLAMAPATATFLTDLITGRSPALDPAPYRVARILSA
ncbi:NAD(P)/FAD-dependent oxidoreductase [Guyparkeria sp.]|uniref:NAD(P)/FAD-dependent oxidoreductase n=1 Tax=Guyparkeria sp. TaxID=2035736 RepID=UPI003970D0A6